MKAVQMVMNWQGLFPLSALMFVLAAFATYLTQRTLRGPQPAAFGHLQTLCDSIDAWSEQAEQAMYWGD